jgi:hypothetical protein
VSELGTSTIFGDSRLTGYGDDLTDVERDRLLQLAVAAVARQAGVTAVAAAIALDEAAGRGAAYVVADGDSAVLMVDGEPVAAARRDFLRAAGVRAALTPEERGHGRA